MSFLKYLFFCLPLFSFGQSDLCLFDAREVIKNGEEPTGLFSLSSTIFIGEELLLINEKEMVLTDTKEFQSFSSMTEMEDILDCKFFISQDFPELTTGNITTYTLDATANDNSIYKLEHISFTAYYRKYDFVFINKTFLFEFINVPIFTNQDANYFTIPEVSGQTLHFVQEDQLGGAFEIYSHPEYEDVTETFLNRTAYDSLYAEQATFVPEPILIKHETSTCPDAIVETTDTIILVKEMYTQLSVSSPEFETVYEQIQDTPAYYGDHYYIREMLNIDTINVTVSNQIEFEYFNQDCTRADFLRCALYDLVQDSSIEVSNFGNVYPTCKDGYQGAVEYCFSLNSDIPATYKTRSWEKLSSLGEVTQTPIPAEYKTVQISRITNKGDLDQNCITESIDTLYFEKMTAPASTKTIAVPAIYETVTFQKLKSIGDFGAIPSNEMIDSLVFTVYNDLQYKEGDLFLPITIPLCVHQTIALILKAKGYQTTVPKSEEYYLEIIKYQIDNRLNIGAIDRTFLDHLNVQF